MTASVSVSGWRPRVVSWVRQHLLARPALPLAALTLGGCLLMLGVLIHPVTPPGRTHQNSLQILTAGGTGIDYYQFWIVGRARERLHPANIYSGPDRRRMAELGQELLKSSPQPSTRLAESVEFRAGAIETFSTPFLYAVINAVASGRYDRDYDHYLNVCLAVLLLSIVALGWLLRFSLVESLLFAAALVLWSEPLASDLRVGNVNQLELAGLALYLVTRFRSGSAPLDLFGGFLLGLLVAFKPTLGVIPLLLAVALIVDRRWRSLARQGIGAAAGAVVAFVTGCLFLGSWSAWFDWARVLPEMEKVSDISVEIGNCSLAQVILEATGGQVGGGPILSSILLLLVLGLAGVVLFRTRAEAPGGVDERGRWFERDLVVTSVGCAISVLTLRLVWLHYYILVIPLLLHVLRPGAWMSSDAPAGGRPRLRLATLGPLLALLALAIVLGGPPMYVAEIGALSSTLLYLAGAWGLLLLGLAALWLRPSGRPPGVAAGSGRRGATSPRTAAPSPPG